MKTIGLLMVADEDDILERTLAHNAELVDCFYVLDGSTDPRIARDICLSHAHCYGYSVDGDVRYTGKPRDGWRQHLLEQAYADHGRDNWFVLLHGDEVWTFDPADVVCNDYDGYVFRLPFYFPRDGEPWHNDDHPIDQLQWRLGPGWPELRMFKGGPGVDYNPFQHFDVTPRGLRNIVASGGEILHYPYRAPDVQAQRAKRHELTGFDPDNYRHILDRGAVYWTDEMIAAYRAKPQFAELRCHEVAASGL